MIKILLQHFSRCCGHTSSCAAVLRCCGAAVLGAVAEQLGRMTAYLERPNDSTRYLTLAREQYLRAGTPALLQRIDAAIVGSPVRGSRETGRLD